MSVLLLITEQEVKDLTSVADNVDISKFRHHIQAAQDVYIKPAIGETCYDALLDSVEKDDPTALETILLNGDNRSFAGLKMALAWWVLVLAYPDLHITIGNSSLQKKTGDNFEPASLAEVNMKRKSAETTATHYTRYLIDYINKHSSDYDCYVCDGITPLTGSEAMNLSGIAFDKVTTISESQYILRAENG
tara:strand:- start:152 stop:724 length:573 start_codon:yes stop_codon:yes gene_type:complete